MRWGLENEMGNEMLGGIFSGMENVDEDERTVKGESKSESV